ncbi:hypothetical protein C0991_010802 [Blastosporella zonata]|nr:hypothetical protein C0991_010802 [Blastosporella zonata]
MQHDGPLYWFEYDEINTLADRVRDWTDDKSLYVISGSFKSLFQKATIDLTLAEADALLDRTDRLKKKRRQEKNDRIAFLARNLDPYTIAIPVRNSLNCYAGTRLSILHDIQRWIYDISPSRNLFTAWLKFEADIPPQKNFLWLTGESRCGKSAVVGSIADYCLGRHILGATLYIDSSSNPDSYFPAIAHQLSLHFSEASHGRNILQQHLYNTLKADPMLVHRINRRQATKLFVEIVKKAAGIDSKQPLVIIIDGLDKTKADRLEETVAILSGIFEELAPYHNAKIMICSGSRIATPYSGHVKRVFLDRSEPYNDIMTYMCDKLDFIGKEYYYRLGFTQNRIHDSIKRLDGVAQQASRDIFKAFMSEEIFLRHVSKYGAYEIDRLVEYLNVDIDTAEATMEDKERRRCFAITSLLCKILENPQSCRLLLGSNGKDAQVVLDGCQLVCGLAAILRTASNIDYQASRVIN